MWPFKNKITVKEAYYKLTPVKFGGLPVISIEHHGKGYGPMPLDSSKLTDKFLVTIKTDDTRKTTNLMLDENDEVEVVKNT